MINGEETREITSGVASPDPLDSFPSKSDGGDASPASLSQYSSCGESENERYCSANSIMGTPSMCSSIGAFSDCIESEFGSIKSSFGLGDDSGLENFSLGANLKLSSRGKDCLGDRRVGFFKERIGASSANEEISVPCETRSETVSENVESIDARGVGNGVSVEGNLMGRNGSLFGAKAEGGSMSRLVGEDSEECLRGLDSKLEFHFGGGEMEREEDGNSSRYEHSEGEDSMYGTDDELRDNLYYPRNVQYRHEAKSENENPFFINSSVAFGSEDWDDFEQETGAGNLPQLILDKFQEQKKQNLESERNFLSSASVASPEISSVVQTEGGKDQTDVPVSAEQVRGADDMEGNVNSTVTPIGFPNHGEPEQVREVREVRDITVASNQVQGAYKLVEDTKSSSISTIGVQKLHEEERYMRDISVSSSQAQGDLDEINYLENCSVSDVFEMAQDQLVEKDPLALGLNTKDSSMDRENHSMDTKEVIAIDGAKVFEDRDLGNFKLQFGPLADDTINQICPSSAESPKKLNAEFSEDCRPNSPPWAFENITRNTLKDYPVPPDLFEAHHAPVKIENLELNDFYDEVVHDMEEILLDSSEPPMSRFPQGNRMFQSQLSLPLRNGGPTASTSGTDYPYPLILEPMRIDGVEVVGAKQKKGNVSISERLVGVKEYTVYIIRVWSGNNQWEVERRYRDFFTLYRRMKSLFADQGWILPSSWSSVERESRKIFGNVSPNVISERSVLIQECLRSILHSRSFSSPPSALIWFLSPKDSYPSSPASNTLVFRPMFFNSGADTESISTLGKTISLIVEIRPQKSTKQLLEAQHYTCAGCHKHFDDGMTLMRDFVQTFGWGKPRLCEYTGQLFCSSCHTNESAVLPARVLHHWDFSQYSVSQMTKSYLDSIHDQPMLCVSAVNPFLFSKVPALHHVMGIRKKIGTMLPYIRCPFRRSINKGLGSRRYLLESNDFFALRDLIDLSKGAFAALPVMVETVSRKILEHITEQCLVCCDVGVACRARQACNDPSSLIFPFQEGEIERCPSCESVFHEPCFRKLTYCQCGAQLRVDDAVGSSERVSDSFGGETSGVLDLLGRRSGSGLPVGFLSRLFSKTKAERMDRKDSDTVILMGSLPNNAL